MLKNGLSLANAASYKPPNPAFPGPPQHVQAYASSVKLFSNLVTDPPGHMVPIFFAQRLQMSSTSPMSEAHTSIQTALQHPQIANQIHDVL